MDLELTGKVAVITGPAKGMGAAISLGFAREGADLACRRLQARGTTCFMIQPG